MIRCSACGRWPLMFKVWVRGRAYCRTCAPPLGKIRIGL